MPLLTNSIGSFTFDSLKGVVHLRQTKVRRKERQGATGTRIIRSTVTALPTTLTSIRWETNRATIKALFDAYAALIEDAPQMLIQYGVSYGTFAVADVQLVTDPQEIINALGTIVSNPSATMVCKWDLQG